MKVLSCVVLATVFALAGMGVEPAAATVPASSYGGYVVTANPLNSARASLTVPSATCDDRTGAYTVSVGMSGRMASAGTRQSWSATVELSCDARGRLTARGVLAGGGGRGSIPVHAGDKVILIVTDDAMEIDDQTSGSGVGSGGGPSTLAPTVVFGAHTTTTLPRALLVSMRARANGDSIANAEHHRQVQPIAGQVVVSPTSLAPDGTFTVRIR